MIKIKGTKLASFKLIEEIIEPFIPEVVNENMKRPEHLQGSTYKISPTNGEKSLYVTINDIVLNEGTEHEEVRPFEIFINSKNVEHVQWVSALTRVMSAVFRKGGDYAFLVEELQEVYAPNGGYWNGPKYMDSIVANIGQILETHINQKKLKPKLEVVQTTSVSEDFPESAVLCKICRYKAVIIKDGCPTCLNCGDSKCG